MGINHYKSWDDPPSKLHWNRDGEPRFGQVPNGWVDDGGRGLQFTTHALDQSGEVCTPLEAEFFFTETKTEKKTYTSPIFIGSMEMVYLPTWMVDFYGFHVGKYAIDGSYGIERGWGWCMDWLVGYYCWWFFEIMHHMVKYSNISMFFYKSQVVSRISAINSI